jgi:hypothetical protein
MLSIEGGKADAAAGNDSSRAKMAFVSTEFEMRARFCRCHPVFWRRFPPISHGSQANGRADLTVLARPLPPSVVP